MVSLQIPLHVRLPNGTHFDDAYRELSPRALAAARGVLRDSAAAEDVVQEVFIELWRKPTGYDPARGSLASYVTMLARCRALDRLRTQAASSSAQERSLRALPTPEPESAAEPVLRRERSLMLLGAIEELPRPQREALLLWGAGLSTSEVAAAVDVPLGTVKSRMRLGFTKARTTLQAAAA